MDFQVNGETYFVSLAEDERRWLVLVESAMGTRERPGLRAMERSSEDFRLVVEDKERRENSELDSECLWADLWTKASCDTFALEMRMGMSRFVFVLGGGASAAATRASIFVEPFILRTTTAPPWRRVASRTWRPSTWCSRPETR